MPTIERAHKIAIALNVSLDFLVSENQQEEVLDKKALERIKQIESLPVDEKSMITAVIDAFLRDTTTKQAYAS
jgi:hypothetical protein